MKPKKSRCIPFLLTACLVQVGVVSALPVVWTGATNTDFATGANWVSGNPPANDLTTDIATFSGVATVQPSLGTNRQVNGVNFVTGGWTLGGTGTLTVGTGGITSTGDNTILANLSIDNGGAKVISSSTGSTLTLNKLSTGGSNANNLTFGSVGNTGTIVLTGNNLDNGYLSAVVAYGTVILNKGTVGGTTDVGSAVDNLTVNAGATAKYGINSTDRNGSAAAGRGQVYGDATINGTLDLNGNGVFSDNWTVQHLNGNSTGLVTNTGSGAAQLRIAGGGAESSFAGLITDGATATTAIQVNIGSAQSFNNAANSFTGGTEILGGKARYFSDGALGAVPTTASTNITMNGATARLVNLDSNLVVNVNRTISIGAAGGGFQSGWSKSTTIDGAIIGTGKVTIFSDSGNVVFTGINTYSGNTVIENSSGNNGAGVKFTLADNASMLFQIGANGVNNQITGLAASGTLIALNGDFNFNLALANLTAGNVWNIVDVANLGETFGSTFTVNGFTENADVWTKTDGSNVWTFSEATGLLTIGAIPEPSAVALLSVLGVFGLVRRNRR
jgi:autotransporter-associated beta strand protein